MNFTPRLARVTREKLLNRPRTLTIADIAAETGLSPSWLTDFAASPDRDHGVNRVETLYYFFTQCEVCDDASK